MVPLPRRRRRVERHRERVPVDRSLAKGTLPNHVEGLNRAERSPSPRLGPDPTNVQHALRRAVRVNATCEYPNRGIAINIRSRFGNFELTSKQHPPRGSRCKATTRKCSDRSSTDKQRSRSSDFIASTRCKQAPLG
ncbi:hypothetical protein QAD02_015225 [Eretmocerus hayati]|uniref:Uncharacterized protein n=1 Tax=Eretmocerus hayati TaxID=131215 RepID=A0ACC2P8K8_9HYME|nr:hypothetical protein QAD02_015225 [Eretmocerus hayati]